MSKKKNLKPLLLTPGPVSAPPALLKELSKPMIHHRSQEFAKILKETKALLKKIFQTQQEVIILNSSGTGAMSSALLNTLSLGDTVLVLSAGKFGQRWKEMAKAYKLKTLVLSAPWGQTISIQKTRALLKKYPQIKAVLVQACETSTGVLHPIKELAQVIRKKPGTLFIVDAISALGALDIKMDQWGIDVLIGGSQKAFCLPAGLSFIALSKKAWQFNKKAQLPVYYFDLKKENQAQAKGQTAFSSNISSIRALHSFLLPLKEKEGLKNMIQKCEELSRFTLQFCKIMRLEVLASSSSVTSIALPKHIDGVKLKQQIETKYQVVFGGGQGQLKGRIIRVGHLGAISLADLKKSLKLLAQTLHSLDPTLISKKKLKPTSFSKPD